MSKFEVPDNVKKEISKQELLPFKPALQLPDEASALPSVLARSALFSVIRAGRRKALENINLYKSNEWEINFTGIQLNQQDLDVFLGIVSLLDKAKGEEYVLRTSRRELLSASGRKGRGKTNIEWLKGALRRLMSAGISLKSESKGLSDNCSMIRWQEDEISDQLIIYIQKTQSWLWEDRATYIDMEDRRHLKGNLTKWMQAYVSSCSATDKRPSYIGLNKLKKMCGATSSSKEYKRLLKDALAELMGVSLLKSWEIKNDVLYFVKHPYYHKKELQAIHQNILGIST